MTGKPRQPGHSTIPPAALGLSRLAAGLALVVLLWCALGLPAAAHGVGEGDARFVSANRGTAIMPFLYLGAKHMVTGYDHLLYLAAILFFVRRIRDALIFATLFSAGHSLTLLLGVLFHTDANSALVDAAIGLSIVYKAFENIGGFRALAGIQPNPHAGVFCFGLIHGLGLATKLLSLRPSPDGLLANLVSFNVGVEIGQFTALGLLLLLLPFIRSWSDPVRILFNLALMVCGFLLAGYHLATYWEAA